LFLAAGKRIDLSLLAASAATQQKKAVAPTVTIEDAIYAAAQHLHLPTPSLSQRSAPANADISSKTDFGDMGIAKSKITGRMLWLPQNTFERVKLVWEVNISPKKSSDSWRILVDANTGKVIKKENYTVPENWNKINAKEEVLEKGKSADNTTISPERTMIMTMVFIIVTITFEIVIVKILFRGKNQVFTVSYLFLKKHQVLPGEVLDLILTHGGYHPGVAELLLLIGIRTDQNTINIPGAITFWHRKIETVMIVLAEEQEVSLLKIILF
jgi:hypothetical protein